MASVTVRGGADGGLALRYTPSDVLGVASALARSVDAAARLSPGALSGFATTAFAGGRSVLEEAVSQVLARSGISATPVSSPAPASSGDSSFSLAGNNLVTINASGASRTSLGGAGSSVLDSVAGAAGPGAAALGGHDTISVDGPTSVVVNGEGSTITFINGSAPSTVLGGAGNTTVFAGAGGGLFVAGDGGDGRLVAGSGAATLTGGRGNDTLVVGPGSATIDGGPGADTIVVQNGTAGGLDVINHFRPAEGDRVSLQSYGPGEASRALSVAAIDPAGAGSVTLTLSDNTRLVFTGITSLSSTAFI